MVYSTDFILTSVKRVSLCKFLMQSGISMVKEGKITLKKYIYLRF